MTFKVIEKSVFKKAQKRHVRVRAGKPYIAGRGLATIPKTEDGLWLIPNPARKTYWHPKHGKMTFENASGTNVENEWERLMLADKNGEIHEFEPLHNDPVKLVKK